jgi:hypothetical protein
MAAVFAMARVKDAIWPEVLGIFTYAGAQLVAASLDAARQKKNTDAGLPAGTPWIQYGVTALALGGGAYAVGTDRMPGFAKGAMYAAIGGVAVNVATYVYNRATKQPTTSFADVLALVPRKKAIAPKVTNIPGNRGLNQGANPDLLATLGLNQGALVTADERNTW